MTAIHSPDTSVNGAGAQHELTDGYHLIVDALKLNDVDTVYGLVGIPITDLARIAQASGIRYIGFRHESDAIHAASAAGFFQEAGRFADSLGPGIPQRSRRAGERHHELLPGGADLGLQ
jgi:hypothetical protein